jgi:tetratricopeptide (TPR) repeat protein
MGLDRVGAARDSFERAVSLRPKYADARLNLAGALYFLGLFDHALRQCETALAMPHGDRNVNAWIGEAMVLRALGRHAEARKAESVADRLTPV